MKKRISIITLCIGMLISCFQLSIYAKEEIKGVYDGIHWEIEDNQLTLSGEGTYGSIFEGEDGYNFKKLPWNAYEYEKVVVEEGITGLQGAFGYAKKLTEVSLPSTIKSLVATFWGCSNLKSVTIPEGVVSLYDCFAYCTSLEEVNVPSTTQIISYGFYGCSSLKTITIPGSVVKMIQAFRGCSNLEEVRFEEGITTLKDYVFKGCSSIDAVYLPSTLQSVGSQTGIGSQHIVFYAGTKAQWETLKVEDENLSVIYLNEDENNLPHIKMNVEEYYLQGMNEMIEIPFHYVSKKEITDDELASLQFELADNTIAKISEVSIDRCKANYVIGRIKIKLLQKGQTMLTMQKKGDIQKSEKLVIRDTLEFHQLNVTQVDYKSVKLIWSPVKFASYYQIYRYNSKNGTWVKLAETTERTWEDSGYTTGKPYQFCVRAIHQKADGSKIYGDWSNEVTFTTTLTGKPRLTIEKVGTTRFKLYCSKIKGATRYIIYRKSSSEGWKKIRTLSDGSTYISNPLPPNNYTYQVKAARYDSKDRVMSEASNKVSGESTLKAPQINKIARVSSQEIQMQWNEVDGASAYDLYRSDKKDGTYRKVKRMIYNHYDDTSVVKNKTYYYKVRAVLIYQNQNYYSKFSSVCHS